MKRSGVVNGKHLDKPRRSAEQLWGLPDRSRCRGGFETRPYRKLRFAEVMTFLGWRKVDESRVDKLTR